MKTLYIIAGANGSGKTTFAINFSQFESLKFINADEIAKKYAPNDIQKYKVKAGKEFFKELQISLNMNDSFVIETTLSGKYLIKIIDEAQLKGFKISLVYLFLETKEENIFRVTNRVLNGGHDVPIEDIKRRYDRSRKLFQNIYRNLVDNWTLVFNGDDNFETVADENEIYDEILYEMFLGETK
ncbi:MAG TPA: hypothetical protein ENK66_05865 [Arcobacter sp.]|nr:hypothetical protein [Arcobacter sp.]